MTETLDRDCFGPHVPFRLGLGLHVCISFPALNWLLHCSRHQRDKREKRHILAMEYALGAPRKSVEFYEANDSGMLPNSITDCKTKQEDCIFYITHKVITTFLSGPNLSPITARFQESLTKVSEPGVFGYGWLGIPDLTPSSKSRS